MDTPSTAHSGAIPTASFGANAGVISSSAAPAAGPEAIAQAEALQRQALDTKLPRSQQMALVQQALALRQGKAPAAAPAPGATTPAAQANPAPAIPAIPAAVTEEARLVESYGLTPDDISAADQALSSRVGESVTAVGLARLAHVGSEAVDGILGFVETMNDADVAPFLAKQRDSVERLYASPEAHAEAVADVREAVKLAFGELPPDLAEDIGLAFDHSPRVHQQIVLMARQVLRGRRKF